MFRINKVLVLLTVLNFALGTASLKLKMNNLNIRNIYSPCGNYQKENLS